MHTHNTNILTENDDTKLKAKTYTGGLLLPENSEYQKVLKKRKSRLSTLATNTLDLDCRGAEISYLNHLIGRSDTVQLNYACNLRNQQNPNAFTAKQPWQVPAKKCFTPSEQMSSIRNLMSLRNFNPKKDKLVESFQEKNINNILHTLEPAANKGSTSVYAVAGWQCSLRGDRLERIEKKKEKKGE